MKRMFLAACLLAGSALAQEAPAAEAPGTLPTANAPAPVPAPEGTVAQESPAVEAAHEGDHAAAAHEGAHGEGHHGPGAIRWLPTDEGTQTPYVFMLLNFAILIAIYVKAGKQPVAEALEKRRADFVAKVDEADRLRREAEARAEKYKAQLATLAQDLAAARAALEEAGKAEQQRLVTEARERAERMKQDAEFLVRQEQLAMRDELQRKTAEAAIDAAAKLLAQHVTAADQERLADGFLAGLSSTSLRRGAQS
jgi:F-type H+-transporting ATPase subunit b